MNSSIIDKIIIFLFSMILFVDSVNGFMIMSGLSMGISLSQLFKVPLLFLMLFRIFHLNKRLFTHIVIIYFVLIVAIFVSYTFKIDIILAKEFTLLLKLLVIPIGVYYFVSLKSINYEYYYRALVKIFSFSFVILFINIFLGLIGLGFSSYSNGAGNKGFFYAGNELSTLYFIICSFLLQYTFNNFSKKYFYILSLISLVMGMSISTKVSMVGILFVIILIYINGLKVKINSKFLIRIVLFGLIISLGSFVLSDIFFNSGSFERWVYFFKRYDYDYVSIILSGRNITLVESFNMSSDKFNALNVFFGFGHTGFLHNLSQSSILKAKYNEMDFFDLYFIYGILGLLSVLSVWFVSLYQYIFYSKRDMVLLLTVLLLLFISFMSGHVLYSGLSGPFIGAYLSLLFSKKDVKVLEN